MARWQAFLNSLASKGGNLFVLVIFTSSLLLLVLHVFHRGYEQNSQAVTVIMTTFSGFSGALLRDLGSQIGGQRSTDANGSQMGVNGSSAPAPPAATK